MTALLADSSAFRLVPNFQNVGYSKGLRNQFKSSCRFLIPGSLVRVQHERAGSTHVLHLHGEVMLARSTRDPRLVRHLGERDIKLGDLCALGSQLRPYIVWFGEMVPAMDEAVELVADADVLLVVGTSLQVYPAAGLVFEAPKKARRIVVNPDVLDKALGPGFDVVAEPATVGVPEIVAGLLREAGA